MVLKIELTAEGRRTLGNLRRRADQATFAAEVTGFFDRQASIIAGQVSAKIGPGDLKRRTGNLARSIVGFGSVVDGRPGFEVGVLQGPALAYAAVQEYGTRGKNPESPIPTIVPKRAKALAIPVGPALTPAGVPRYEGPRSYPGPLSFRPALKGRLVGVLVNEDDEAAYILVTAVDIEPKAFLEKGVEAALPNLVVRLEAFLARLYDSPGVQA